MFVEITRGRSFKGLAQYCLHDVGGKTAERVAFVETRNLATEDPQLAWRVMAARHYLQDELKEKAGVGKGGRKDGKPVGHLLISWKREEAEAQGLDRAGMMNAANGALKAIGAGRHQAMVIGHTDTDHPHCHVIVNLIGDDGKLKKNWKEREKLSKFALQKEIEVHGEPVVKTRRRNCEDRQAGETPAPVKKKPRHLYEIEKAARENDDAKTFAERHRKELAAVQREKAAQLERQRRHRDRLLACLKERDGRIVAATDDAVRAGKTRIRKSFRSRRDELLDEQEAGRRSFESNERNLKGSLANAMALIDWKKLLRGKKEPDQVTLSHAFQILTSEATRRETLRRRQEEDREKLRKKQHEEEKAERSKIEAERAGKLRENRAAYLRKLEMMKDRQAARRAELDERQRRLTRERNEALKTFREQERQAERERPAERRSPVAEKSADRLTETFRAAASPSLPDREEDGSGRGGRTRRPRKERPPRPPREKADSRTGEDAAPADDYEARVLRGMRDRRSRENGRER